jgi:hypothetical protein
LGPPSPTAEGAPGGGRSPLIFLTDIRPRIADESLDRPVASDKSCQSWLARAVKAWRDVSGGQRAVGRKIVQAIVERAHAF